MTQRTTSPAAVDYLLVGGGLASATAAASIRARDPRGSIALVADESEHPYHRPPLSKELLRGEIGSAGVYGAGGVFVQAPDWYQRHGVILLRGTAVAALDPAARQVLLANGTQVQYRKLLLATGGRARRPAVPGADLRGVYVLRTLADADALRAEFTQPQRRVIILGARFIGLETASACLVRGARVTLVDMRPRLWPDLMPPHIAEFFAQRLGARGASFRFGYQPVALLPDARGRVAAVRIAPVRGGPVEDLPCDLVIVGLGIALNTELAVTAGLRVDPALGILVNDRLETSAPGVFAAGDVIGYPDPVRQWMHFEHWDHAIASAQIAALNMTGGDIAYRYVPYFFSDQLDVTLNVVGYPSSTMQVVVRGDPASAVFTAFYIERGLVRAALMVNDGAHLELLRTLVARETPAPADPRVLAHPSFDLASLQRA
jgi:3-phenylpropionate/trans-cinnamate dioxygenase ferredoxin reductase subunit